MQSKGWALTLMWRLLHPRRVGDFVKPCHTQGCRGTPSPKLESSMPALPPHPSLPGVALAGHLSPAVGFGGL